MRLASIDARAVKHALRAGRYAEPLGDCSLIDMAVIELRLRTGGQPDTRQSRAAELGVLLDDLIWEQLDYCRGEDRSVGRHDSSPEHAIGQAQLDFQSHDLRLEAWSALYCRYIADTGLQEEELADRLGISYRTLARRISRGHEALAELLREMEFDAEGELLAHPGRLPEPISRFIGRESEIIEVAQLVVERRLVTLTGPGGIGKTRLAVEVARRNASRFAEGVSFIDLTRLAEPLLVPAAVAGAVGVRPDPKRSLTDAIADYLRDSNRLLLLDNCEHVLQASVAVATELLQRCPAVHVLATSRELLHVSGEAVYVVPPLTVPPPDWSVFEGESQRTEAVELFEDRASATLPGFSVAERNAGAVFELCRRLDGLPLALELAAHRINVLSASQIVGHLDNKFGILRDGTGGGDERHLTLRAALDWSYDLLTSEEQCLFRRLSVFAGGADLEAVTSVCSHDKCNEEEARVMLESSVVVDALSSLVGKSLLIAERGSTATRRYCFLPTLREYARDRLQECSENHRVGLRHAAHFAGMAESLEATLTGAGQPEALDTLAREHDNMRAALGWAIEAQDVEMGLRLSGSLARFWELQGHVEEGRRWMTSCLELPGADAATAVRAKVLSGAGSLAEEQGDFASAESLHRDSLRLRRELADEAGVAESLNNLGNVLNQRAEYQAAVEHHEEALQIRQRIGDEWAVAVSLNNLGNVAGHMGELQVARTYYERSARAFRGIGDRWALSAVINNLGVVACDQGDYDSAESFLCESLAVAVDLGDRQGEAYALHNLGDVALHLDRIDEAREMQQQSMAIAKEVCDLLGVVESLESFAALAVREEETSTAAELLGAAHALRQRIGAPCTAGEEAGMEELLLQLRETMGEDAFSTAWEVGMSLSEEDAQARALET